MRQWDTPGQWYRSGMSKSWRYNGRDKCGAMLVVVLLWSMGMLQLTAWLLSTFCEANDCRIG